MIPTPNIIPESLFKLLAQYEPTFSLRNDLWTVSLGTLSQNFEHPSLIEVIGMALKFVEKFEPVEQVYWINPVTKDVLKEDPKDPAYLQVKTVEKLPPEVSEVDLG